MERSSVTVKILEQIRDSIGETNSRLDALTSRVVEGERRTAAAIGTLTDRVVEGELRTATAIGTLTDRVVEGEIRTATAIAALAGTLGDVTALLKDRLDLRDRLERCELDIVVLKERITAK